MVKDTRGLVRQTTYEEAVIDVELDQFKDAIRYPDRTAKFVLESPELLAMTDSNEEELIEFEKRKAMHRSREEEVQRVAL